MALRRKLFHSALRRELSYSAAQDQLIIHWREEVHRNREKREQAARSNAGLLYSQQSCCGENIDPVFGLKAQ